jgi:hypothetical protein
VLWSIPGSGGLETAPGAVLGGGPAAGFGLGRRRGHGAGHGPRLAIPVPAPGWVEGVEINMLSAVAGIELRRGSVLLCRPSMRPECRGRF